jgi:predicted MPP superfamily phosphohydrolase
VQWGANPARELVQKWLKNLKARHGIFAVMGNHDYKGMYRYILCLFHASGAKFECRGDSWT